MLLVVLIQVLTLMAWGKHIEYRRKRMARMYMGKDEGQEQIRLGGWGQL
jgi:hypothetical protein